MSSKELYDQEDNEAKWKYLPAKTTSPPPGGYPFPKNDHVTTKMGNYHHLRVNNNHWDKECPDWAVYLEQRKRQAQVVESKDNDDTESVYKTAYQSSWINDYRFISQDERTEPSTSGFKSASWKSLTSQVQALWSQKRVRDLEKHGLCAAI
ncbi:hypothetical protein Hypma_006952 [Hypsizygus marmoreus]|uniref:Uncharacterized protein n=1 Tax=Hypsizygus marmoreus TaxID=39966 RepID=A0A369JZ42_HYPMA|nr:hypothetical protein Hypma_006952 [Hypsizygus marmoreus]